MPRLEKKIAVAAPPEVVWGFAVDPSQWHTWFEGLSEPKSIQGDGSKGTVVKHNIKVHNIPMPLETTVVTFDPGCCWKAEYTGPMTKGTQEWVYVANGEGTDLTFIMETELSGPAKLAEGMVVNAFEQMTDKMLANLKSKMEA